MKPSMKGLLSSLLLVIAVNAFGQDFLATAKLNKVDKAGFYAIPVTPELSSYLTSHFANLRIRDENGDPVPYVIETEEGLVQSEFVNHKIISLASKHNCCTDLVIANPDGKTMSNFSVRIRNADVLKRATLSGSDGQSKWFALRDNFPLYPIANSSGPSELRVIDFPLANYRYYKLSISDSTSAPLNILEAGFYRKFVKSAVYDELALAAVSSKDSVERKSSYVRIRFAKTQWVDRITLGGSGLPLFIRPAKLYSVGTYADGKGKLHKRLDFLGDAVLSHERIAEWKINSRKVNELLIEIDNDDNPSLKGFTANVYQLKRNAVVWLEPGKSYQAVAGNRALEIPEYDLRHFSERIPRGMKVASYGKVELADDEVKKTSEPSLVQNRILVWVGLGGIILLLAIMSLKMVRQVKNEN